MKKEFCPNCGQSIMQHKQSLSKSLVGILYKCAMSGISSFHLQKDINLNHNQYTNFQKLKFWGLVMRDPKESGRWIITQEGRKFLNGSIRRPRFVWTFNNRVVRVDAETISIQDLKCEPFGYKLTEQYAKDARPMNGIGQHELTFGENL